MRHRRLTVPSKLFSSHVCTLIIYMLFETQAMFEFYLNDCALHLCDEIHHEGWIDSFVLAFSSFMNEKLGNVAVESWKAQIQSDIVRGNRLIQDHASAVFLRPTGDVQKRVLRRPGSEGQILMNYWIIRLVVRDVFSSSMNSVFPERNWSYDFSENNCRRTRSAGRINSFKRIRLPIFIFMSFFNFIRSLSPFFHFFRDFEHISAPN